MNYDQKKVLVVGMARSGVAAAQLLRASGAVVTVNDSKPESELGDQLPLSPGPALPGVQHLLQCDGLHGAALLRCEGDAADAASPRFTMLLSQRTSPCAPRP